METDRTAVALGDFDGMHLAHQTVVTGAPDALIYCVNNRFSLLQKSIFVRRYPHTVFADFDLIKELSGREFADTVLLQQLQAGILLCGYNFRCGKDAKWTALDLRNYLESKDVWVRILEHQDYQGEPISSTRIRRCLQNGDPESANAMLGYAFTFEAPVIGGDQRGRTIGFPTINQRYPEGLTVPKQGVYESRCEIDGVLHHALTNIGVRPSWRVNELLAETHIFDFDGNLYGETVRVELVRFLREEQVFHSVQELKEQLRYDKSSIV